MSVAHHVVCSVVRVHHAILGTHDAYRPSEHFVVERVQPNDQHRHLSIISLIQLIFISIQLEKTNSFSTLCLQLLKGEEMHDQVNFVSLQT